MRGLAVVVALGATTAQADAPVKRVPRAMPTVGACLGLSPGGIGGLFATTHTEYATRTVRLLHIAMGNQPNQFLSSPAADQAGWDAELRTIDVAVGKLPLGACLPIPRGPHDAGMIVRGRSRFIVTVAVRPGPGAPTSHVEISRNGMPPRVTHELSALVSVKEQLVAIYTNAERSVVVLQVVLYGPGFGRSDHFTILPLE